MATNLLRHKLTDSKVSSLSKGLKFYPTPRDLDRYSLCNDVNDFISNIRLKEYFFYRENVEGYFSNVPAFRNRSVWCPVWGTELAFEAYPQAVEEEILTSIKNEGASYSNLSPQRARL